MARCGSPNTQATKSDESPPAGAITEFDVPTPDAAPHGITTGPDGALWFTEQFAGKIGRITTAGAITEFTVPTPGSYPAAIVTGSDGALWFVEHYTNKIGRITTAGAITEYPVPTPNSYPVGIDRGTRRRAVVHRIQRRQDRAHHHRRRDYGIPRADGQ